MAGEKIKLDEEAITEILVADTNSESGFEASNFEDYFLAILKTILTRKMKKRIIIIIIIIINNNKPQQKWKHKLHTTSGRLPTWTLPQGRNTNIHPFVSPAKDMKKSEAPHINKDSSPLSVLMLFFTVIFHLLVEQTNMYYQQHLDKADLPADCLTLRCQT